MVFLPLRTPRLLLRPLEPADAPSMHIYRSILEVSRFQTWEPQTLDQVAAFIEAQRVVEPDTPGTWFQLAITLRESGLLIGDCGFHTPKGDGRQAELGITISPAHQGQGHATEALRSVLEYLFTELGKHRVYASVDPRNRFSVMLLGRLGMKQEAHFRESLWFKGEWADDLIFALLEREWKAR